MRELISEIERIAHARLAEETDQSPLQLILATQTDLAEAALATTFADDSVETRLKRVAARAIEYLVLYGAQIEEIPVTKPIFSEESGIKVLTLSTGEPIYIDRDIYVTCYSILGENYTQVVLQNGTLKVRETMKQIQEMMGSTND